MIDSTINSITPRLKTINSFVRRSGKISMLQKKNLINLWRQYGIGELYVNQTIFPGKQNQITDFIKSQSLNLSAPKKIILEIGFGLGDSLFQMAVQNPELQYIGVEVHLTGIARLLNQIQISQLNNLCLLTQDAQIVLTEQLPNQSLSGIQIFFPDPWHKTRHHKRRLIQPEFLDLLAQKLKPGGFVHIATDWKDYAEHILSVFEQSEYFKKTSDTDPIPHRPKTKYELRGERLGHVIYDFYYQV
jgi:tRNA (guanine-N7-)-methyltransferase